jgi:putative membrane protein insertion efficiency factor
MTNLTSRATPMAGLLSLAGRTTQFARAFPAAVLVAALRLYQRVLSPVLPVITLGNCACRFSPTCSHYAVEAIGTHGAIRGLVLAVVRLAKCTPLHPGGFDPVPPATRRPRRPQCTGVVRAVSPVPLSAPSSILHG